MSCMRVCERCIVTGGVCSKNTDLLKMGIELSIRQHHVVFKETSTILSHRLIRLSKSFRYVIIRNGVDLSWLLSPSALHRLGRFLVDATKVLETDGHESFVICHASEPEEGIGVAAGGGDLECGARHIRGHGHGR